MDHASPREAARRLREGEDGEGGEEGAEEVVEGGALCERSYGSIVSALSAGARGSVSGPVIGLFAGGLLGLRASVLA